MEFKSQVYTTIEQSKRLIALGIKTETADCCHYYVAGVDDKDVPEDANYPAWSLHRLMEIIQNNEKEVSHILDREDLVIEWFDDGGWKNKFFRHIENTYDRMIYCIEYMLKEGLINPEYLEEQK